MDYVKKTICGLDCPDSCGLIATVKDGKVVSLEGDPEHPFTNGFICRKMRDYPRRLYSEKRVLYPQVRIGPKGKGEFKRISWPDAWDLLVLKIKEITDKYGSESILPYSFAGNKGSVNRYAGYPLFNKMCTSNLDLTICSAAAKAGWASACEDIVGASPETASKSKVIIAWGINILKTNVHFWQQVKKARQSGAKLVVIDPYLNATGKAADQYVQVKPGGDSALALGILKIMIQEGWHDRDYIAKETKGFGHLEKYLDETGIEKFEEQSGITKQEMTYLASLLIRNSKVFIRIGVGLSRNSRGGMAVRSICALAAGCGLFDGTDGRGVLLFTGAFEGDRAKLTFPELAGRKRRKINMIQLGHALTALSPPIKSLIVYNSNPASVAPDGSVVRKGLARDDLFTVVHEQVMTPTARYADLLLPATTFLENRDIIAAFGHFYLGLQNKIIDPVGEAISNFDFFQTLAKKMGYSDLPFLQTLDDRLDGYCQTIDELPDDFSLKTLEDGGYFQSTFNKQKGGMFSRVGKYFKFSNSDISGAPFIPSLIEEAEIDNPVQISRYPYRLISPPNGDLLNSTFGDKYENQLSRALIHPEDANRLGIKDGNKVCLYNVFGSVHRIALISTDTTVGLVVAEGLYWPGTDGKNGINDLVPQKCSDMGGGALFHEIRIAVRLSLE